MDEATDYVFLHGGVQGGWVWSEAVAALGAQTNGEFGRALALDIPGCGAKRDRRTDGLGMDEIAADLIADIEAAGFRDIVLVGHSQAGTVLPRLLRLRPRLFRRAVYVSCVAPLPGQTVLNHRDPQAGDTAPAASAAPRDTEAFFLKSFCNDMDPEQARRFLQQLGRDSWPARSYSETDWPYDHLGATPASYFVCLRDAAVPAPWQERFAERFKASSVVRLDAGHQVMITRPHALAEALRHEARRDG